MVAVQFHLCQVKKTSAAYTEKVPVVLWGTKLLTFVRITVFVQQTIDTLTPELVNPKYYSV